MTAIHEFQQFLWVETPHGSGQALLLIDYGPHNNAIFVVALQDSREIKHYDSNQIKISINHTFDFT